MEERNCGNEDTEIKYIWNEAERGNTGENATKQESVRWVTSILESGGVDRKILEEMVSKRMEKKNMRIATAAERIWRHSTCVLEKYFWQTWKRSNILHVMKGIYESTTADTKATVRCWVLPSRRAHKAVRPASFMMSAPHRRAQPTKASKKNNKTQTRR